MNSQDFQKKIPKIFNPSVVFMLFYVEKDMMEHIQVKNDMICALILTACEVARSLTNLFDWGIRLPDT